MRSLELWELQSKCPMEYACVSESLLLNMGTHDIKSYSEQCLIRPHAWVDVANWFLMNDAYNWHLLVIGGRESLHRMGGFKTKNARVFHPSKRTI